MCATVETSMCGYQYANFTAVGGCQFNISQARPEQRHTENTPYRQV